MTKQTKALQSLTTEDLLKSVPWRNQHVQVDARKDDTAVLSVPMKKPSWLVPPVSWVLPYSSHKRVQLDQIGFDVYQMCDGERTIEQVVELFSQHNKLTFRESQVAVMQFLRQLTERGMIVLVGLSHR